MGVCIQGLREFLHLGGASTVRATFVDGLEVIHVGEHNCARLRLPQWCARLDHSVEPSTVRKAGQLVPTWQSLQAVNNNQALIDDEEERDQGADHRSQKAVRIHE